MKALSDAALGRLQEIARVPDLAGTRYRITAVLGEGGMGTVYEADDTSLNRRVALKVLDLPDDAGELAARLLTEAQVLAQLEHPGVVPVHDVGQALDGRAFYVMKLVQGERLDRHVLRATALTERLRLFLRICEAMAFAHARGILHRDLKPPNVMVGPFGEVLVLDWGLAKVLDHAPGPSEATPMAVREGGTGSGAVLGTPGYMAPEQAAGRSACVDARADVFSLGAILAFLLRDAAHPAALRAVVSKAMAGTREARYPSAVTLAADIEAFLDGAPVSAYPEGLLRRALRLLRRHQVAVLLVLAYLAARALVLFFFHR